MHGLNINKGWTVAVIGGGPAGSASALSLLQQLEHTHGNAPHQHQVHIFDAKTKPSIRIGETIPPAATEVLNRLHASHLINEGDAHTECPGSISQWNSDQPAHNDFFLDLVGKGYHLNRNLFDEQLLEHALLMGAKLHRGWRLGATEAIGQQWRLRFQRSRPLQTAVDADFVVDASGKSAAFCRRLNVFRNICDEVIFICAIIELDSSDQILPHTFVESVPEGWWYAAKLPHNKMVITFCTDKADLKTYRWDNPERWLGLLRNSQWMQKNLPKSLLETTPEQISLIKEYAPSSLLSAVCGNNWLAVGDAASSCDPITSAGITKSLIQGEHAGKAIAGLITGDKSALTNYQQQVFADFSQYIGVRNSLYRSEQRFTDQPFWRRRYGLSDTAQPVG